MLVVAERSEAVDEFTRMERFISARQDLPHVRLTKDLLSVERFELLKNIQLSPLLPRITMLLLHIITMLLSSFPLIMKKHSV